MIHEQKQHFVHESVNPVVKTEEYEKPVVGSTEVKKPIFTGTESKETIFVKEKGELRDERMGLNPEANL